MRTTLPFLLLTALIACDNGTPVRPAAVTKSSSGECAKETAKAESSLRLTEGGAPSSYKGRLKAILEANCTSCHGKGGDEPELHTFAKLKEARKAVLTSITEETMPKKTPLKPNERDAFFFWKAQGYPEADGDAVVEAAAEPESASGAAEASSSGSARETAAPKKASDKKKGKCD